MFQFRERSVFYLLVVVSYNLCIPTKTDIKIELLDIIVEND